MPPISNPFEPVPNPPALPSLPTFEKVDDRGHLCVYKREDGLLVKLKDLGPVKKRFEHYLLQASMTPLVDIDRKLQSPQSLTAAEAAAYGLAYAASTGSLDSVKELFDRILGKPKQYTETVSLKLTIDDILNQAAGIKPNEIEISPIHE